MHGDPKAKILCRPKPFHGEGLLGYLARVSEANGYDSLFWLLEFSGCTPWLATRQQETLGLATMLGLLPQQISNRCYWPAATVPMTHQFMRSYVSRHMINLSKPRVCPACLDETGFRKCIWDFSLVACCSEHGTALIDYCPTCMHNFSWGKTGVDWCQECGAKLSEIDAPRAPREALDLTKLLLARLDKTGTTPDTTPTKFAPTRHLNTSEFLSTILFLGAHACGKGCGLGLQLSSRLSASAMLRLVDEAAQILSEWPSKFFSLLDGSRNTADQSFTKSGITNDFGPMYEALTKTLADRRYSFLKHAFANYVRNEWDGGFVFAKNHRTGAYRSNCWVTRAGAARLLHTRGETISKIVATGQLKATTLQMGSRTLTLVDRASLARFQLRRQDHTSFTQLRFHLGLSEKTVRSLIERGYLRPAHGISCNASRPLVYPVEAVLNLLKVIPTGPFSISNRSLISFKKVARKLTSLGYAVVDVIELVLAKRLIVIAADEQQRGFAQCLFSAEAVAEFIRARPLTPPGWRTIPEAALAMGLKQQVVYHLVKNGCLAHSTKTLRGRRIRCIKNSEAEKFSQTYIPASKIAGALKTSPKQVIRTLAAQGIDPTTGPHIDGNRQCFFKCALLPTTVSDLCHSAIKS